MLLLLYRLSSVRLARLCRRRRLCRRMLPALVISPLLFDTEIYYLTLIELCVCVSACLRVCVYALGVKVVDQFSYITRTWRTRRNSSCVH